MGPTDARDDADVAFDRWLRAGLHARYGAIAAAPVPQNLIRLAQNHQATGRATPATLSRFWDAGDTAPAFGLAMAVLVSGLLWAALAGAARTLWG